MIKRLFSPWLSLAGLMLFSLLLTACGGGLQAGALPTLAPTETAVPHATPTRVSLPTPPPIAAVDWEDIERFRGAMRPPFAADVDAFADRDRYYIEARLELTDLATVYGSERVRYTNHSGDTLDNVVFRLYPNLTAFGSQMNITGARVDGQPVVPGFDQRRSVLDVPLIEPLAPGESVEIVLDFNTVTEGGHLAGYGEYSYLQGVYAAPEWYPVLSIYEEEAGAWWTVRATTVQGEATYTETGLYEIMLTADEDVTIALSGTEIETIDNGDGTLTHHIVSGPMRDSMLVASRRLRRASGEVDGIAINVYYWDIEDENPPDRSRLAAERGVEYITDALRTYNRRFGEYPFNEFDMVQTATVAGGIEYPGLIVVADDVWNTASVFYEVVVAHEVGHQWWYSLVGNNAVDYPFVDESLTSFTEYVYFWETAQTERDVEFARDYVRNDQNTYNAYLGQGNPDLPLGLPTASYVEFQYVMVIYTKGPLFFNEITDLIGREQVYDVLQEYFRRHRYSNATITDLFQVFEDVTGQQWDALFYEWVGRFPGLDAATIATVDALESGG